MNFLFIDFQVTFLRRYNEFVYNKEILLVVNFVSFNCKSRLTGSSALLASLGFGLVLIILWPLFRKKKFQKTNFFLQVNTILKEGLHLVAERS